MDEATRHEMVDRIVSAQSALFMALRADWTRELLATELTLPQMKVLVYLERAGQVSMSQLADLLGKSQPTVTGLVDRLVEAELVTRAESPTDRRVTLVRLAPDGRKIMDSLLQVREDQLHQVVSRLSPDDLQLVMQAFDSLDRAAKTLVAAEPVPADQQSGADTGPEAWMVEAPPPLHTTTP